MESGDLDADSELGSVSQLWQQYRGGDNTAASDLYERLLPRMYAVARKSIGPIAKRGVEADDVVQSAMMSFMRYTDRDGLSDDKKREDLWSLVATFTARKAIEHFRRERTLKRGGGKVVGENALQAADGYDGKLSELVYQMPTQEFDLAIEELLAPLDQEMTRILLLKMSSYTNREIADFLECTDRKIERKLARTRAEFRSLID